MPDDVILGPHARRFLRDLPQEDRIRISTRLRRLLETPIPSDAKFMGRHEGDRVFRYRIGPYRVIYKPKNQWIIVSDIGYRKDIYDRKP